MAAGRGRSRRVSLPGVAELLRPAAPGPDGGDRRRASGREKHTQKITVYLSAEELLDLERARLALLRYGAAADRHRIVREAIARGGRISENGTSHSTVTGNGVGGDGLPPGFAARTIRTTRTIRTRVSAS